MSTFVMIDAPALVRVTTTRPCGCVPPTPETTDYQTLRAIAFMHAGTHDTPDGEHFDGFLNIKIDACLVGQNTVKDLTAWLPPHCRVEAWRTGRSLILGGDDMAYHQLTRVADGTRTFEPKAGHRCQDAYQPAHSSRHYFGTFEAETGVTPYRDQWARPS